MIAKETNVAGVAANCILPERPWKVAEIVAVPLTRELTAPGVLFVATMAGFEEDQLACAVTSPCVPSL
jgi:hypothetical protein